jgi:beta-glucosidase
MDRSLSPDRRADLVLEQLTLDEKISLVHGAGFPGAPGFGGPVDAASTAVLARANGGAGIVPGIPRLGIPDLNMADSAVGVTRGAARGRYSTALPSAIALAASWDPDLAAEYGALIGRELRDQGYNVSLGGGVNITREPRNGRNFEYQGEDPLLAGRMAGRLMKAMQAQHVIGDLKHYAVNDQETGRNVASANVDRRALRETDLLAFEIALRESDAGMVMAAYNRVNGDYCSENTYLLNDVLKKAWGFKGFVLSDWGGTHSSVKAALAGLDQEQPGGRYFGAPLKEAVQKVELPAIRLNEMVRRILRTEFACGIVDDPPVSKVVDPFRGREIAQRVAEQSIVLLKNSGDLLPLGAARTRSIAVIGGHADVGVLSGGGSAQVEPAGGNPVPPPPSSSGPLAFLSQVVYHPSPPLRALRGRVPGARVDYDPGADPAAAARLAGAADLAIVFASQHTHEGEDMPTLSLPENQDTLIEAVVRANPRTIVVLETGGPVTMPWLDRVPAVLEAWYPGIGGAEALAALLFGDVNPSAKLPVTFPRAETDLPHPVLPGSTLKPELSPFPGAPPDSPRFPQWPPFDIDYHEGLKVGYRWFDAERKEPRFPFGYGLSYTNFAFSDVKVKDDGVEFAVRNTGRRAGAEIAQVYASLPPAAGEPPRRLVGWQKVTLAPGQARTVRLRLELRLLSIFNPDKEAWELVPGEYRVSVGGSSRDLLLSERLTLPAEGKR